MWPDNETETDLLGFSVHKDLIRQLVTNDDLLPLTVGVFGDWGGGKSSILRMLSRDLETQEDVACLYFSSWVFEGYDDAKAAVLTAILARLAEDARFTVKVRKRAASLLKRVDWMRGAKVLWKYGPGLVAAGGTALGLWDPSTGFALASGSGAAHAALSGASSGSQPQDADGTSAAPEGVEIEWEDEEDEEGEAGGEERLPAGTRPSKELLKLLSEDRSKPSILEVRTFRRDFEKLIAETHLRCLVVLIDDLDRCSPERLIETLEAIKLFVSVPKTAFVIAADERIVRHAIATRYAAPRMSAEQTGRDEPYDLERDYLEKVIQVPYRLPKLSPSEIESYVTLLFCQLELGLKSEHFADVLEHCRAERAKDMRMTYGGGIVRDRLGEHLPAALEDRLRWTGQVAPVLNEGLKGNPRQVKRFLNAILLRKQLAALARLEIHDDVLVKLMLLEYSRPELFDQLYEWQAASEGFPPHIAQLERAAAPPPDGIAVVAPAAIEGANAGWQERQIQAWLRTPPALADVDLRDYFWVARDRISGALTGLTTVPLVVQQLATSLTSPVENERSAAAREAARLDPADRATLIRLLGTSFQRKSQELAPFDGLVALAESGIPGSAESLVATLERIPEKDLPARVGYVLERLVKEDEGKRPTFTPLLERWSKDATPIGLVSKGVLDRARTGQDGR